MAGAMRALSIGEAAGVGVAIGMGTLVLTYALNARLSGPVKLTPPSGRQAQ